MTQSDYDQKKQECWEEYKRENLDGEVQWQLVSRYDVFCAAFDRAYALGKQETKQETKPFGISEQLNAEGDEMLTVNRKRVQELYNKFDHAFDNAVSDNLMVGYYRAKMGLLKGLFGSKCLPDNVDSLDGNVDSLANLSEKPTPSATSDTSDTQADPEPCTEPEENVNLSQETANCDNEFGTILKDSFRNERRLNIAAMAMQGMLSNTTRFSSYEISDLVRISLNCADALIAESVLTDKLKGE